MSATRKDQLLSLFSFNRQFNLFFILWRIDDWKPWMKKNKIWQVNWTEQVELNRISNTNVVIFNNKNFYLFTFDCSNFSSTKYLLLSLFEKTAWKIKRRCQTFNTRIFSTLKHLPFFKTKLVSHSIKVCSHCNFSKPFLVYVVKMMERVK